MGGFNEVIGLWSSLLGVLTTIIAVIFFDPRKKRVVTAIGFMLTLVLSILIFFWGPKESVEQVVNNFFNNTIYETSVSEFDVIEIKPKYNSYTSALVFQQKSFYTVPLDQEKDKTYEVYKNIPVTEDEVTIKLVNGMCTYSYRITDDGFILLDYSIQTPSLLNLTYKGITYSWKLNNNLNDPVNSEKVTLENSFSKFLLTLKNSEGKYIKDDIVYISCEGNEIMLTTNEEGMINSYLFLSSGIYSIYTKNDDGEHKIQATLQVPNNNLNETNTIVLS